MKKYGKVYKIATVAVFLMIGAVFTIGRNKQVDITELAHNHHAMKLYEDGAWEWRYESSWAQGGGNATEEVKGITLSVNVLKDMTREDMVSILDYFELVGNAKYVGDTYVGEKDTDFIGYATFFQGDTDEEVARVKYMNGKEAEITEEDEGRFPPPYFRPEEGEELGPWL